MRGASFTTALTTAVGLTLTLILIGALSVLAYLSWQWEQNLRAEARVQVYFQRDVEDQTLQFALEALRTDPAVAEARFLDAEAASRELEDELGESFVDFLGYVPLPEAMDLTLRPADVEDLRTLAEGWQDLPGVSEVVWPEALLGALDEGLQRVTRPLAVVAALFLVVSVLLMNNTIRLNIFAKRFIIKTMQLVGAKPSAIRGPFIRSGIGLGIASGLFAFAAVVGMLNVFRGTLGDLGAVIHLQTLGGLAAELVLIGLLIGGLSTWVAVNRYLRLDANRLH